MRKPRTYTPDEVAEIAKVSRRTVYEWLRSGTLEGVKAGDRLWRVPDDCLKRFLTDRTGQVPSGVSPGRHTDQKPACTIMGADTVKRGRGRPSQVGVPQTKEQYDRFARQEVRQEVLRAAAAGRAPKYTLADFPPFKEPSRPLKTQIKKIKPEFSNAPPLPIAPLLNSAPPQAAPLNRLDLRSAKPKPKARRH